ncbi:MAG: hypothetical protein AAFU77_08145 [Myxococcota bacterium]
MTNRDLDLLSASLERAWEAGCPVAGSTSAQRDALAKAALHRMRSFDRRASDSGHEVRVRDLAAGLAQHHKQDPKVIGRLKEDYRWLASQLLDSLGQSFP